MLNLARLIALFVSLHCVASAPGNIPWKSWTFCKEVGPNEANPCLAKAIPPAFKDINGNGYFGTPSMDPLSIPELAMHQAGQDRPVAVNVTFKNVMISGLSKHKIKEVKTDWKNGLISAEVDLTTPIIFESDYTISGKVILLPITGAGKCRIVLNDLNAPLQGKGTMVERKGKKYFSVNDFKVGLKPKSMTFYFENLFNGNKALGDNMNKFLTENWQEIMNEVGQPISLGLGEAFKQIAQRVFAKIPADSLILK